MAETIKLHDFVELDYSGKLTDGTVFDTTREDVARRNKLYTEKRKYAPAIVCVGEKQILSGLDEQLVDKEVGREYTIPLSAEQAFGKRDVKKLKIVPLNNFQEHKVQPYPGLQIDVDGELGTITRVAGGRVIVNFNHPLSGKEVVYDVKINRKITDSKEQIAAFLNYAFNIPLEQIKVELKEETAEVTLPMNFPAQLAEVIGKNLAQLTQLKEIHFKGKEGNPSLPAKE